MATHLYHIAQEAVNNAIKHGQPRTIAMELSSANGRGMLVIRDDGKGFPEGSASSLGMGLHIMNYRAGIIGGALEIRTDPLRGTIITCIFPVSDCG
jgi:signal transduction histidine kinase